MVRAHAASAGFLRLFRQSLARRSPGGAQQDADHPIAPLLDYLVPCLVVVFLAITTISMSIQYTTSRHDVLQASEDSLAVAAVMASLHASASLQKSADTGLALHHLPPEIFQPGRQFVLVDALGDIKGGTLSAPGSVRSLGQMLAEPAGIATLLGDRLMHRMNLADERLASMTTRPLAGGGFLVAIQPVEDELYAWRKHAAIIIAILLSFGAVTIAFSAAYYLQRDRAKRVGLGAGAMRERFETALTYGNCGLWDIALNTGAVTWSASMSRLLGYAEDAAPRSINEIAHEIHPEDQCPSRCVNTLQGGLVNEVDHLFRMRHQEKGWVWLRMRAVLLDDAGGAAPRLLGIVMDVTAERTLEEASHRADMRLRDAIESISEAFVLWDEDNRLVLCNSKYQAFHGLNASQANIGARYKAIMENAKAPRIENEIVRSGGPDGAREYEAQFDDGRWLLVSERHTKAGGYVSVGTDITERKRQENQVIESERQLRLTVTDLANSREVLKGQAQQLAELADRYLEQKAEAISANRTKAEFLANMHHEIRTPLNHMIGFAQIIEQNMFAISGADRYSDYGRDIRKSGEDLMVIFNDILAMAEIEAGRVGIKTRRMRIGPMLHDAAEVIHPAALVKSVTVTVDPALGEVLADREISVDPDAIHQALSHLLRNSIRLAPVGSSISVRARMQGGHINLFIADAGSVLSADELGKLNGPFGHIDSMLEDGCKGSGLGVAIARSLIELHGGTLRMRSNARIGSLVMIHLPITQIAVQLTLPMGALSET